MLRRPPRASGLLGVYFWGFLMSIRVWILGCGLLAAVFLAGRVEAATLVTDPAGVLRGANGVKVAGQSYDVRFHSGTCIALFDGCDGASDLPFQDHATAIAAARALLDQVLIDSVTGAFDSAYPVTILTPFLDLSALSRTGGVTSAMTYNDRDELFDTVFAVITNADYDTASQPDQMYAVWQLAAVPLPASGWLLLAALTGLAARRRAT